MERMGGVVWCRGVVVSWSRAVQVAGQCGVRDERGSDCLLAPAMQSVAGSPQAPAKAAAKGGTDAEVIAKHALASMSACAREYMVFLTVWSDMR